MNSTQPGKPNPWKLAVGILALCAVVIVLAVKTSTSQSEQEIKTASARLRDMRVALHTSEAPRVSADSNAAPLYDRALKRLPHRVDPRTLVNEATGEMNVQALATYVAKLQPSLDLVETASRRPACVFKDPEDSTTSGKKRMDLVRACCLKARFLGEQGDFKSALTWIDIGLRVSKHLEGDGEWGVVHRCAGETVCLSALGNLTSRFGSNPGFRTQSLAILRALPQLPKASTGVALSVQTQVAFYEHGGLGWNRDPMSYRGNLEPVRQAALAKTLTHFANTLAALRNRDEDWEFAQQTLESLKGSIKDDNSTAGILVQEHFPTYLLANPDNIARLETYRRLTESALLLYNLPTLPTSLPQGFPVDPFSGKPFIYEKSSSGFRLYSVGPNDVDDGGPLMGTKAKRTDDIACNVGRW